MRLSLLAVAAAAALSVAPMAHAAMLLGPVTEDFSFLSGLYPVNTNLTDPVNHAVVTYGGTTSSGDISIGQLPPASDHDLGVFGLGRGGFSFFFSDNSSFTDVTVDIASLFTGSRPLNVNFFALGADGSTTSSGNLGTLSAVRTFESFHYHSTFALHSFSIQTSLFGLTDWSPTTPDGTDLGSITFAPPPSPPPVTGVPEPANWALMLVGFFGLGAALRARRQPLFATL